MAWPLLNRTNHEPRLILFLWPLVLRQYARWIRRNIDSIEIVLALTQPRPRTRTKKDLKSFLLWILDQGFAPSTLDDFNQILNLDLHGYDQYLSNAPQSQPLLIQHQRKRCCCNVSAGIMILIPSPICKNIRSSRNLFAPMLRIDRCTIFELIC